MTRATNISVAGLTTAVLLALPSGNTAASCFQCKPIGSSSYTCTAGFEIGFTECEDVGPTCHHGGPNECEKVSMNGVNDESIVLADGYEVRGKHVDADAFAVRTCYGEQLTVLYSERGAAERLDTGRVIVLD